MSNGTQAASSTLIREHSDIIFPGRSDLKSFPHRTISRRLVPNTAAPLQEHKYHGVRQWVPLLQPSTVRTTDVILHSRVVTGASAPVRFPRVRGLAEVWHETSVESNSQAIKEMRGSIEHMFRGGREER